MIELLLLTLVLVCPRGDDATQAVQIWNNYVEQTHVILYGDCESPDTIPITSTSKPPHLYCPGASGCTDLKSAWCGFSSYGERHRVLSCLHELGHILGLHHPEPMRCDPNTIMGYGFCGDSSLYPTWQDVAQVRRNYEVTLDRYYD